LSWFIFSHFDAINFYNVSQPKIAKKLLTLFIQVKLKSFKVIDVDSPKNMSPVLGMISRISVPICTLGEPIATK